MHYLLVFLLTAFLFNQNQSLLFEGSSDYVSIDNFDIENNSITFSFDVAIDANTAFMYGQSLGGHFNIQYYEDSNLTGSNSLSGEKTFSMATWQGGPWDQIKFTEQQIGEFDERFHNITAVFDINGDSRLYYDYELIVSEYIRPPWTNSSNGFSGFGGHDAAHGNMMIKSANIWYGDAISHEDITNHLSNLKNIITPTNSWDFFNVENDVLVDVNGGNNGLITGASWVEIIEGCSDELACNYNETAIFHDGSCDYSCHDNGEYSLSFDGVDDYVDFGDVDIIDDNDFSVQFDLRTDDNDKSFLFSKVGVINQDGNEYPAYYFIVMLNDGTLQVELSDGYSGPGDYSLISGSTPINDNQWHNITVTFDRDDIASIYIDGSLDGSN